MSRDTIRLRDAVPALIGAVVTILESLSEIILIQRHQTMLIQSILNEMPPETARKAARDLQARIAKREDLVSTEIKVWNRTMS